MQTCCVQFNANLQSDLVMSQKSSRFFTIGINEEKYKRNGVLCYLSVHFGAHPMH